MVDEPRQACDGQKPPAPIAWLKAARPATLTAALAPILVGKSLAFVDANIADHGQGFSGQGFSWPLAMATVGCGMLLQIGANFANDYFDYIKGADGPDRLGPPRATQRGWLQPKQVLGATVGVFAAAALLGAYLATIGGWPFWLLGLASIAAALGYTGGPRPYGYYGLGDVAVFVFFGPIAVCGSYYLQNHQLSWPCVIAGVAMGVLATAILVVNNIRDHVGDAKAGKRTLAVRIGPRNSRIQYAALLLVGLCLPSAVYLFGAGGLGWLAPLIAGPWACRNVHQLWTLEGRALNPLLGQTAGLTLLAALLLSIGSFL